jgi:hypothetical protein
MSNRLRSAESLSGRAMTHLPPLKLPHVHSITGTFPTSMNEAGLGSRRHRKLLLPASPVLIIQTVSVLGYLLQP